MCAVVLVAHPSLAAATSCETSKIEARSIEETAKFIFDTSDRLGFGFVRERTTNPSIRQQEVDIVLPLKGGSGTVVLAPRSVNRVSTQDGLTRWFYYKTDELRLFALIATKDRAATPTCLAANVASRPAADLYKALFAESRRRAGVAAASTKGPAPAKVRN